MADKAEFNVEVIRDTSLAICVILDDDDENRERWVPRSMIDEDSEIDRDATPGDSGELVVPQFWAEDEGWV